MEKAVDENKQREGEGKASPRLDAGSVNYASGTYEGFRPNQYRNNGGKWGRRKTDIVHPTEIPLLHRVQESGEVQRPLRYPRPSQYTFDNGTPWRDKDEPSKADYCSRCGSLSGGVL